MSKIQSLEGLSSSRFDTPAILKKLAESSRMLAELKGVAASIPNQGILINTLGLQEAKDSSEIENIVTTHDELFKDDLLSESVDDSVAKEVLRYRQALRIGFEQVRETGLLTSNHILLIQAELERNNAGYRKLPGTSLKSSQGEVVYTPPQDPKEIIRLRVELENFINDSGSYLVDPLIKMAMLHYQFEAIHPFSDGNGRTGRILLLLYLKLSDLLDTPAIYLSEYIIKNKVEYYRCLRDVTEKGEWEDYILYMLDMIEVTANKGLERLHKITSAMEKTAAEIKKKLPKVYSKDLVEILFRLPYTKRQHLIDENIGNLKTVGNYLIALEANGFLKSEKVGKEKLYLNSILLGILENKE
jgi:Fic family protein